MAKIVHILESLELVIKYVVTVAAPVASKHPSDDGWLVTVGANG